MKISPDAERFLYICLVGRFDTVMERRRSSSVFFFITALSAALFVKSYPVRAEGLPPHLIQTVTEQDIYEGMLTLGYLETPVLETEDCGLAYDNVKDCVVRIQMGKAHGSGIIWEITSDRIIVVTNRHVLAYWKEENGYVHFPQGFDVDAQILGVSERFDVGFVAVDCEQLSFEMLKEIRCARIEKTEYERLRPGSPMFMIDPGSAGETEQYYEGSVEDPNRYIEDFNAYMLYGYCYAKAGMSGGGTFDGRGFLIGMTTGGTPHNETASVPLPDLITAYEEVMHDSVFAY